MTKKMAIGIALALTVLGGTAVYAGIGCNGGDGMFGDNPDIEKVRIFQKETLTERDDMMIRRLELKQELAKKKPDQAKVDALRKEMVGLRAKIQDSAKRQGLTGGCLTECDLDPVDCSKGGCGKHKNKNSKKTHDCDNCNKKKK
ncbi:hypothetical protein KI809_03140 [Geobacter pelophilus]|uniref:Zinc resistance-associated protein n=1 Tax=Geoanaerobacter pelophilus TaxID=60036 RepID=A0AAW4KXD7_9BACT|nr:hypothetical protein [Geoanaerobacter pelophilus]MBT0663286.1 hypothetical protein [Geoanaerobacter pelophilus]